MKNMENITYDELLEEFKKLLKTNNLKFTKQREAILKVLYTNSDHFSPESLHALIKRDYPNLNVGIATIYRTLNLLEENGIVTSISFGVQGKKFELGNKPHHDHMICVNCGKIIEFEDEVIEKRQYEIAKKYDFKIEHHLMQLFGLCKECQKNSKKDR